MVPYGEVHGYNEVCYVSNALKMASVRKVLDTERQNENFDPRVVGFQPCTLMRTHGVGAHLAAFARGGRGGKGTGRPKASCTASHVGQELYVAVPVTDGTAGSRPNSFPIAFYVGHSIQLERHPGPSWEAPNNHPKLVIPTEPTGGCAACLLRTLPMTQFRPSGQPVRAFGPMTPTTPIERPGPLHRFGETEYRYWYLPAGVPAARIPPRMSVDGPATPAPKLPKARKDDSDDEDEDGSEDDEESETGVEDKNTRDSADEFQADPKRRRQVRTSPILQSQQSQQSRNPAATQPVRFSCIR